MVVGVPRSGTTLVSTFINTALNAVCLCEPHHEWAGNRSISPGKLVEAVYDPASHLPIDGTIRKSLSGGKYDLAGFKETYREAYGDARDTETLTAYAQSGYTVLAVVRDAGAVWNSSCQCLSPNFPDFAKNYVAFLGWLPSRNARIICYEAFCKDPVKTFHAATGWAVTGFDRLEKNPSRLGDWTGKTRSDIVPEIKRLPWVVSPDDEPKIEVLRKMASDLCS